MHVVLASLLVLAGCAGADPDLPTGSPPQQADQTPNDQQVDDLCEAAEQAEAAHSDLMEDSRVLEVSPEEATDGATPTELRRGAEAALRMAEAIELLAEEVDDPELRVPLDTWAGSYVELAEFYAEIDYDLQRLDVEDDYEMQRLAEFAQAVLFGPDWDDTEAAAFDQLTTTLADRCPNLGLPGDLGGEVPHDPPGEAEPQKQFAGHTVSLSDAAVERIREAAEPAMSLEDRQREGGWGECPVWDPEDVIDAVGDALDHGLRPTDSIVVRDVEGDGWSLGCALVRESDHRRVYDYQQLQAHVMTLERLSVGVRGHRVDEARRTVINGHDVFERDTTVGLDEERSEAFAVDLEHGIALLVVAETPELARGTLKVVLADLTTPGGG